MSVSLNFSDFIDAARSAGAYDPLQIVEGRLYSTSYAVSDFLGFRASENRKVWEVFTAAVKKDIGSNRLERICHRYQIDFTKLAKAGQAVTRKIIDTIRLGSSEVFLQDVFSSKDITDHSLTPEQLHQRVESIRRYVPIGPERKITTLGQRFISYLNDDRAGYFDKNKALLWKGLQGLSYKEYLEKITKMLGGLECEEGSLIPAPGIDGGVDYYQVYRKIQGEGLVAYGLRAASPFSLLRPLILFRPTVFNGYASDAPQTWLNDTEAKIGSRGYSASKAELKALISDPDFCPSDKKVDLAGYSLGGVHAQRLLIDEWRRISALYTFNAPSVDKEAAEEFAAVINAQALDSTDVPSRIEVFRTQDDVAHYVGEKHAGWGITHPLIQRELLEVDFVEKSPIPTFEVLARVSRHLQMFLSGSDLEFVAQRQPQQVLDQHLDNTRILSPGTYWEGLRIMIGSLILFPIIYVIHSICLFSHRYFHISPFHYSAKRNEYIAPTKRYVAQILTSEAESIFSAR